MNETIKIVALDLDGTLLDSEKNLSNVNREALEEAAARGVEIVPTTGRFFGAMPESIRSMPFVRYAITINGAQVYDRVSEQAIVREEMPLAKTLEIMRFLDGFDVIYDCYQDNWGRMTKSMQDRAADYAPDEHYLKMIRELRKPYPDLKKYLEGNGRDVQKVMVFARNLDVRSQIAAGLVERFGDVAVTSSTFNNLEINSSSANKGTALVRFAEHLGLGAVNCMAFGDGMNDLSMIKAAGVGVAMANACAEVRDAADSVTLSNDDDGVAAALRGFGVIGGVSGA